MFLTGPLTRKTVIGKAPRLDKLDEAGDLKFAIDYRSVYATLLEEWLQIPSEPILGKAFEKLADS